MNNKYEVALADLLESIDLIKDFFSKHNKLASDVIDGFLLGADDRAREILENK